MYAIQKQIDVKERKRHCASVSNRNGYFSYLKNLISGIEHHPTTWTHPSYSLQQATSILTEFRLVWDNEIIIEHAYGVNVYIKSFREQLGTLWMYY